jgi:hypothetical protein
LKEKQLNKHHQNGHKSRVAIHVKCATEFCCKNVNDIEIYPELDVLAFKKVIDFAKGKKVTQDITK